jgi:3-phenylpropionate/trans-cinnamate dioxygenase ferredoxin reductase subunit
MSLPILIVGASAAGVSAARTLRANGFSGDVVLIDADPNPPYERPPLSKRVLEEPDVTGAAFPLLTADQAQALQLELRLGQRVLRLDANALALTLAGGAILAGQAILLATGGKARRLALPGSDLAGVHVIRSFADAEALRAELKTAKAVAVIGGGLIGTEAAVAIARTGKPVAWIDGAQKPLAHIFPTAIADHLIAAHLEAGLTLHAGARIQQLVASDSSVSNSSVSNSGASDSRVSGARVSGVELEDGKVIAADVVILGVGMAPEDGLARAAGLEVDNGVHVDQAQRTSAPGVFAAGDVAAFIDEASGLWKRHEHWRAAEAQGAQAARAMLGLPLADAQTPWFWSDQGAHHVEMAGHRTGDALVRLGGKGPIVFELDGDRLACVASVNEPNAVRIGLRLIQSGRSVDREVLADPKADLRALLRVPA